MVIQLHRQLADWARKALGHVLDAMDRLVLETCRDDSRFIDAGSAAFAGKRMRAGLELPIQDVIEIVHGEQSSWHTPHTARLRAPACTCQWLGKRRFQTAREVLMRRRQFLAALGGMATGPLASYAQGPGLPLIGYLGPEAPERFASRVNAFRDGLAETGYIEGHNVGIEFRWADGDYQKLPALAADLAARQVAVMVAPGGAPNALAAKFATTTIPIVFEMGGDPVALGIVPSLSQPGGNLTGVSSLSVEVGPKRLESLHEVIPTAS